MSNGTIQADWRTLIPPNVKQNYERDGVVVIRQAIHPEWLNVLELGIDRVVTGANPLKFTFYEGTDGAFLDSTRNFDANPEFRRTLYDSPVADMLGDFIGSDNIWLLFDHVFVKDGGTCQRTPWHQDLTYWPVAGSQIASMWITLDPIPKHESLEFVRGSHHEPLYDGFDPSSSARNDPYYGEGFPPLPDIEAEREKWDIVSWDIEPGDVIVFHPGVLHGGGPTTEGRKRRTLAVRCYGDDVVYDERPPTRRTAPQTPALSLQLKPGDPLRNSYYPRLRPLPEAYRARYE